MSRTRSISPDFWTCEAVVDCTPMARLLLLGLQTFADDFGVQPLRPRTIKIQVFPGDAIDAEAVREGLTHDASSAQTIAMQSSPPGADSPCEMTVSPAGRANHSNPVARPRAEQTIAIRGSSTRDRR